VQPTRRDFLKLTTVGGVAAAVFGFDLKPAYAQLRTLRIARANETRSTCPYCSVSCGVIIYTIGDRAKNVTPQVVHVEGDPDHPINRGTLCPKGSSLEQDILNDRRIIKPQVRRPGGTEWEDISWEQALNEIAARVKKTRDDTFIEVDAKGNRVNRCESIRSDPDHPINRGTLCPKGSSLEQDILNDRRIIKPQVRRPGGTEWEDISWEQALNEIAARVKKTRDDTFIEVDAKGNRVNRCESI